jgi:hypothetical protein
MGSGNEQLTMYGLIRDGEVRKSSLEAPDLAGIEYIYSHVPNSRMDLVLVFDASQNFASTYRAFTPSKNAATELIDRMRIGDRVAIVRTPDLAPFALRKITAQSTRDSVKSAIASLLTGGPAALGSALSTANDQLEFSPEPGHGKALILFSAGEETALPSALSTLPLLEGAGTMAFTLGFDNSGGQALADTIASKTGGAYFRADSSTIGVIVDRIWSGLTGLQIIGDTSVASSNVPAFNPDLPGLRWQGKAEEGTTALLPGLRWQGLDTQPQGTNGAVKDDGRARIQGVLAAGSRYILRVITPSGSVIDSALAAANPADGIEFVSGATYNHFKIRNPEPGTWTLDAQALSAPVVPEPVELYMATISEVTMDIRFDKAIYQPGEEIHVIASLSRGGLSAGDAHVQGGGPIPDATVLADVTVPGIGVVGQIPLTHTLNGEYAGTFSGTSEFGTYGFEVRASKQDDFTREVTQSVYVMGPFSCPPNMVLNSDPGVCGAVATYEAIPGDPIVFPGLELTYLPPSGTTFPIGTSTVIVIGADDLGRADTCSFTVTVKDVEPPAISTVHPSKGILWPPNHRFVTVSLNYSCTDNCGPGECSIEVGSNEPVVKKGNDEDCEGTSPDWIILDNHTVKLRAERYGRGKGRIYTITVTCTDVNGNTSTKSAVVLVPKSCNEDRDGVGIIGDNIAVFGVPDRYELDQNYPNPFNPATQIDFALPQDSKVSLKIYSTLGELVATVADGIFDAGYQSVEFDGTALASGVYFYRLEALGISDPGSSFLQIRKMMLVK